MPAQIPTLPDHGLLRFLTCGSVDDGKSTLIGRLLFDTKTILADAYSAMERTSRKRGMEAVDLSLLTDGLLAEREQGITIDVAYRYFSTGTRKFIVADAPGHEQYTRNMVTAASTADLAIILVDARKGVLTQTRRHATIAHLLGIPHLLVAVNKMDLVDHDPAVFFAIRAEFEEFAERLGIGDVRFLPISALNGDMLVDRGEALSWYHGPTLLEILESAPADHTERPEAFRFPVQYVCRPHAANDPGLHDYRGFMGRVETGDIAIGDEVTVLPSGRVSRIKDVHIAGRSIGRALAGQSVTLLLEDELDVSRGDMIVKTKAQPRTTQELDAMICWLGEAPLDPARRLVIRHTTRETRARVRHISYRLDVNDQEQKPADHLAMNDIARISLKLQQPLFVDAYGDNRATGAFIVVDEASNNTVGAGMILAA